MTTFKIKNQKGKTVNCTTVAKFTPAAQVLAAKPKPKPKPPRNQSGPTPGQLAALKKGIIAIIAKAEKEVFNRR